MDGDSAAGNSYAVNSKPKRFSIGPTLFRQRELGLGLNAGRPTEDQMKNSLYRKIDSVARWPSEGTVDERSSHGGIFGINFSPDGSMIGVACERKCLLFMDPFNRVAIQKVENAHTDCVNCVKFLDSRLFTTCSDDNTVKLWDIRFVKDNRPIRVFGGHSSWVKDMEYLPDDGTLLTSGFDNAIYAWDINKYSENPGEEYKRIFYMPGLIRMCMTNDLSKMIISTQWGYIFVVHHFDLNTIIDDLRDFKPNMCWLALNSDDDMRPGYAYEPYHHRFVSSKNRTELIADFPEENDAENITSIIAHPFNWCVLSRNTSASEQSEWTCVHDIQLPTVDELLENEHSGSLEASSSCPDTTLDNSTSSAQNQGQSGIRSPADQIDHQLATLGYRYGHNRQIPRYRRTARMSTGGVWRNLLPNRLPLTNRLRMARVANSVLGNLSPRQFRPSTEARTGELLPKTHHRLTNYTEEPNTGRGYIKVQSFSFDGRLIASPFGFGTRLMAFDEKCSELSQVSPLRRYESSVLSKTKPDPSPPRVYETRSRAKTIKEKKKIDVKPTMLHEISTMTGHASPVLCAEFSPTHYLLATGCINGKIIFHEPGFL